MDLIETKDYAYTAGAGPNVIVVISVIYSLMIIFAMFKNRKTISYSKLTPFIGLIIIFALIIFCRVFYPALLLNSFSVAFPTVLMFFTIENPDLRMIEELSNINTLAEKTNISKSQFVLDVTNDILDKLDRVDEIHDRIKDNNPGDNIKEELYELKEIVNTARNKVRKSIDVSQMDSKLLKPVNTTYNASLLFNTIYLSYDNIPKENIEFRYSCDFGLPNKLYGDYVRIKQILVSVLDNSFKFTEKGFIEFRVHSVIRNNICRLMLVVEDTGKGMSIFKINELLGNKDELDSNDIRIIDDKVIDLKIIKKMINLIGGTLTIESKEKIGTKITIIIDQKIADEEKTRESKRIDSYQNVFNKRKMIGVIATKENSEIIKKIVKKYNVNIKIFIQTKDCLDEIRNDIKYDLVIIDENMEKINARSFLSKVKDVRGYKCKMMVISSYNDIRNKKELLDLGFDGIISSPINKKEIKKIIDNFDKE